MRQSPADESPWWHRELVGPAFEAAPLIAPWAEAATWDEVVEAFADPALFELACGMGKRPAAEAIKRYMGTTSDLRLWRLAAAGEGSDGALLVHSRFTTIDRVRVWAPPAVRVAEGVWGDALVALTAEVFRHEPAAEYVCCHLPRPAEVWQEGILIEAGFDPFSVDDDYKPPPREVYGVARADFDRF